MTTTTTTTTTGATLLLREAPMFVKSVLPVLRLRGVRFRLGASWTRHRHANGSGRMRARSAHEQIPRDLSADARVFRGGVAGRNGRVDVLAGRGGD